MMRQLTAADGHTFDCWIEPAQGTRRGGLVILQEIFGVTDQLKGVAARYAKLGYEVAIPALFDRKEKVAVIPFDQATRGRDLMLSIDTADCIADTAAAVNALKENGGKVAVIGFCWGGGLAVRAAQKLDITGGVSFYGTRLKQFLDCPLKAPMQGHFGTTDDHTPVDLLEEVKAYLPDFEMHMYEAGHAFANEARAATYVAEAAELAHKRTETFLAKVVG
ncbi:dienelactone hydrolase family protein [uncultured Roseibium sp.]|uniref:dienelactone hydrolase family protein n=1 Tax=uncultured Roseibium sp. TaxID=1936171 RepID=UPI0032173A75